MIVTDKILMMVMGMMLIMVPVSSSKRVLQHSCELTRPSDQDYDQLTKTLGEQFKAHSELNRHRQRYLTN